MHIFKLSLKELIIITLISTPIGALLYLDNHNKINYNIKAKRAHAIAENFCENYLDSQPNILKDGDIDLIYQKYKDRHLNSATPLIGNISIISRNDIDIYDISFKGVIGQESIMRQEGDEILKEISVLEFLIFNKIYKSIKLHCKSGEYSIFKIQPLDIVNIEYPSKRAYKKSYLLFLLISPFIILYLAMISLRYIIKSRVK